MKILVGRTVVAVALMLGFAGARGSASRDAVDVRFDDTEAEAALTIFEKQAAGSEVTAADWQMLFGTVGYQRLKARESGMGRSFTDAEFQAFMSVQRTPAQTRALRETLKAWSSQPIALSAQAALAYLPPDARLKATVFPMIKPKANEFVYDLKGDPAIFLYLNPDVSADKARNTMTHELHHIGLGSVCPRPSADESEAAPITKLRKWVSAFGEGLAMLAAAGGPTVHPHAVSSADERNEWDRNAAQFDRQLAEQNAFFLRILEGKAGDEAAIDQKMMGYFGVQGPWYTVGWKMAAVIETQLGRARVINAFCDPAQLLASYNQAARLQNRSAGTHLPLWDPRLVEALDR